MGINMEAIKKFIYPITFVVCIAFFAMLAHYCSDYGRSQKNNIIIPTVVVDETPAPTPVPKPINKYEGVKLTEFSASWCNACQKAEADVARIGAAGVEIVIIDIDKNPEYIKNYGIKYIPLFILCTKDGCLRTNDINEVLEKLGL
jgi:thiol-disulfide isomerase/thioredoxin